MKMHDGEADIDTEIVGRVDAAQFPDLTDLPVSAFTSTGTVNGIYRSGDHLDARLPRVQKWAQALDRECHWLPKLAPRLLSVTARPQAVGQGTPFSLAPLLVGGLWMGRRPAVHR